MSKRIHKSLEKADAENEFGDMHSELNGDFSTYEDTLPTGELEEYEHWDANDPQASFDNLTGASDESEHKDLHAPVATGYTTTDRPQGEKPQANTGLAPAIITGVALTLGGFLLASIAIIAPGFAGPIARNLATAGLTPGLIVCTGIMILTFIAVIRRQHKTLQAQLAWVMGNHDTNAEILDHLIEAHRNHEGGATSGDDDVQQALHSLRRQDEKINNLTKALKMYGRPLVDMSRQATENGQKAKMLSTQIAELKDKVDALGQPQDLPQTLLDPIKALETKLEEIGLTLVDPITESLAKVSREGTDEMMKAVELLSEQVTSNVTKMVSALPQNEGTEEILQTLRQELGQLNETLATGQVDAPVANATQSSNPAPAQESTPSPAPAHDVPVRSTSGTAKTSGKTVLGAIAKLKKMR